MQLHTTPIEDIPIACDPHALSAEQQERWMIVGKQMYSAIEEIRELPGGYAFRLPGTAEMLIIIAEDLTMERLCCPFLHFTLEVERTGEPFWLSFTGGEGAKAFLRVSFEEFNMLDIEVAKAVGFNVSNATNIDSVDAAIEATNVVNNLASSTRRNEGDLDEQ
jgi:hypothetical protein